MFCYFRISSGHQFYGVDQATMKNFAAAATALATLCLATDPLTPDKVEADIKTNELSTRAPSL